MNFGRYGTIQKQKRLSGHKYKLLAKAGVCLFRLAFISLLVFCAVGLFAGIGTIKGVIDGAPDIEDINVAPSGFKSTLLYSNGSEIQKLVGSDANREEVNLEQIPKSVQNAFIAVEDERFWSHNGIDIRGILRAFFGGLANGDFDQGASTLTQQLIKNQVFNGGAETTFGDKIERKLQEQFLAIQLEQKLSKAQILEYYLNTINLGQNTLGVQSASKRYFNKDVSELTLSEASVIAGITQNPSALNPITHPEDNKEKRAIVLDYMQEQGYITKKEKQEALSDDVYARIELANQKYTESYTSINSYFVDALIEDLIQDLQEKLGYSEAQAINLIYRGGLTIETTQSKKLQKVCDSVLSDESLYPSNSEWALVYRLSTIDKDGNEHNYSELNLENYFINEKGQSSFDLYFDHQEDAEPYIEEYREHILNDTDEITGEYTNFTIQPQISFVLINQHNGKVLAMVGGRGEKTASRTLNRATDSKRQPGSTFKILSTYLPALDTKGMTLASVQDDSEFYYPGSTKQVENWDKYSYKGLTTLRQGIAQSMNVVTVKTMVDVTPTVSFDYLTNLGFTTIVDNYVGSDGKLYSDINYPTALGGLTLGVTNYELTAAFASVANGGVYTKPKLYTKVYDHSGTLLLDNESETKRVMKETTAWLLTDAMRDVVTSGTGTLARFSNIQMDEAGKTGTTTNNVDAWFVGYTPYYTASIWSGYDNNKKQSDTTYHKTLWRILMEKIHQTANKEYAEFKQPENIVTANICTKSGKLAVEGLCDSFTRTEYFDVATVPTETCDAHVKYRICTISGELAGEHCPSQYVIEKVFLLKEETGTTEDTPYVLSPSTASRTCGIHKGYAAPEDPEENNGKEGPEEEPGENETGGEAGIDDPEVSDSPSGEDPEEPEDPSAKEPPGDEPGDQHQIKEQTKKRRGN